MTGLLICAAVMAALLGGVALFHGNLISSFGQPKWGDPLAALGLALIAVALWLAYAAGAQP